MRYDHIIIGTGQAGPPLASVIANHGQKVAIIEKGLLGGTCVNTGCTPSKAYIASARRAWMARESGALGIRVRGEVEVDFSKVKERKDLLIGESRENLERKLTENDNISLFRGKAEFAGPHRVKVNGKILEADHIHINTGARAMIPEGYENVDWLTNETLLDLDTLPRHLIIVGGGYVALEFGQMFSRLGSKITLLVRGDRLVTKEDKDISEAVFKILKNEGLDILLNTEVDEAVQGKGEVQLKVRTRDTSRILTGSHLLLATGRQPNTDDLGLEKVGVRCDEKGYIQVDEALVTNIPHIRALGDCNGQGAFTHTAYHDFQIVASHLYGDRKRYLSDRIFCYAIYIDPALARVGMNEQQIRKKNISAKVAVMPVKQIARAKEKGETAGILKIWIDSENNTFLGATFLGPGADEYIHSVIDMMYGKSPYTVMKDAVHIHPTFSELLPTMLENLRDL